MALINPQQILTRTLVIGDTAAGKSTFINFLLGEELATPASPGQLHAQTQEVTEYGDENILIDTPGLNDPNSTPEKLWELCSNIGRVNATFLILRDFILTNGTLDAISAYRRIFGFELNLIVVYPRIVYDQLNMLKQRQFDRIIELETQFKVRVRMISYINTVQDNTDLANFIRGQWAVENRNFRDNIFQTIAKLNTFDAVMFGQLPCHQKDLIDMASRLSKFLELNYKVDVYDGVLTLYSSIKNMLNITIRKLAITFFNIQVEGTTVYLKSILEYLGQKQIRAEIIHLKTINPITKPKQTVCTILVHSNDTLIFHSPDKV